jgi:signal transduction histidine kinase
MNGGVTPSVDMRATCDPSTEEIALLWHDLRQAVAAILASVSAVEADPSPGPEARRWLSRIAEEARRISRVSEHALCVGGVPPVPRSLDEVVSGVIDSARVVSSAAIEYRRSGADVWVDGVAVERALANVVENACRAAGPEGRVRIQVDRPSDGSAIVTVDDSGPGFGASGARQTGLGLEVVRRALESLGGSLRITERGPLGGARVQLCQLGPLVPAARDASSLLS